MVYEKYIELPRHHVPVVSIRVVQAVPDTWSWMTGVLHAPQSLIDLGLVLQGTRLELRSGDTVSVGGVRNPTTQEMTDPDLHGFYAERRHPILICFEGAGLHGRQLTLGVSKSFARHYFTRNYSGRLDFTLWSERWNWIKAECELRFQEWCGHPGNGIELGNQPPRVKLSWDTQCGGSIRDVAPIIEACRALDLKEYTPVPNP